MGGNELQGPVQKTSIYSLRALLSLSARCCFVNYLVPRAVSAEIANYTPEKIRKSAYLVCALVTFE
jgi:hypothetical protein